MNSKDTIQLSTFKKTCYLIKHKTKGYMSFWQEFGVFRTWYGKIPYVFYEKQQAKTVHRLLNKQYGKDTFTLVPRKFIEETYIR